MTADPDGALSIAWNAIDLPRTLTTGSGTGASSTQRAYLADGSLAQVGDGTTTRLYLGDIIFDKASNGTVTLESAGWEGGRLLPGSGSDKVLYVVKDHLGSVRVVKDGQGNLRQRFDYYPYGTVSYAWTNSSTTDNSEKRYRFGGKEIAGSSLTDLAGIGASPGAPYLDFGARLYSPRTATWMSPDPLMEKYYGTSPLAYCIGNPVSFEDNNGSFVETAFDAASLIIGVRSFVKNVKAGKVGAAIVDGIGVIADAAAVATPFVPGGVSMGVKAARGADHLSDGAKAFEKVDNAFSQMKNADRIREGRQFEKEAVDAARARGDDVVTNVRLVPKNGKGNVTGNRSNVDQLIRNEDGTYTVVETKLTPKSKPTKGQSETIKQVKNGSGEMEVRSTVESFELIPGSVIQVNDYQILYKYK